MSDIYSRVLSAWRADGVSLVPSMDYAGTAERFLAAGLSPAMDFIRFYSMVGGMTDSATDHNWWSCWSIEKIIEETREYPRSGIPFADWLIHSHLHVARGETEDRTSIWVDHYDGEEMKKVADSLEDFLNRYLMEDETTLIFRLSVRFAD